MIGIIDYGMGNLQSVRNSCEFLGREVRVISRSEELDGLTQVILPGVGAFSEGMKNLTRLGLVGGLRRLVQEKKIPFLGICLGMQLLADRGTEGGLTDGLAFIPGTVVRFDDSRVRVPHIGWNNLRIRRANPLLTDGMAVDYYFVHSYYLDAADPDDVIADCEYGIPFACAVGRANIFGVQFHPEKSHEFGLAILKNFFRLSC